MFCFTDVKLISLINLIISVANFFYLTLQEICCRYYLNLLKFAADFIKLITDINFATDIILIISVSKISKYFSMVFMS